jgi:hypothetical protein
MCLHAEALRLRAQNVALRFSSSKDDQIRSLADAMVLAYLALAANEEWLAGTVHPYAVHIVREDVAA